MGAPALVQASPWASVTLGVSLLQHKAPPVPLAFL